MATFNSKEMKGFVWRDNISAGEVIVGRGNFNLPAAALAVNDVINLLRIPNRARILNFFLKWAILDTGTPAFSFSVGDNSSATLYRAATVTGGTAGQFELPVTNAPKLKLYTEDDVLKLTVAVAAATQAPGALIEAFLLYTMD